MELLMMMSGNVFALFFEVFGEKLSHVKAIVFFFL